MLESLSNLQLLILLLGIAAASLIFVAWCIRRFLLQVPQPSKNILWLIAAHMCFIAGIAYLIDSGCQYLSISEFIFFSGQSYCTLPRFYWSGISFLGMAAVAATIYWIAKSPLLGGGSGQRHLKAIFDD